jgi:excisionase family DNA binding protein
MAEMIAKRVFYTITEVAEMTGRDRSTIHRWLERGVLKPILVPGGKRMVQAASLEKLIQGERVGSVGGPAQNRAT